MKQVCNYLIELGFLLMKESFVWQKNIWSICKKKVAKLISTKTKIIFEKLAKHFFYTFTKGLIILGKPLSMGHRSFGKCILELMFTFFHLGHLKDFF